MTEAAPASRHFVVGTAGHIDHGKTSLVRALSGVDTDRLPEEKKRGITIELGFAQCTLANDVTCSLVDVPGHEKFVRTMVAGAAGIDAVVLVVAGDDAVMPQTREHLAICSLLGVKTGVVALTKCDLIDADMRELVELDIADSLAGTFLEGAPVISVSSTTGEGIEPLREALAHSLRNVDNEHGMAIERPYLGIDRVFTRAGFGTVVTGTLLGGSFAVGDAVAMVPGLRADLAEGFKIRGLEVHGVAVDRAESGRRVAVNLRGIDAADVVRSAILMRSGDYVPTSAVHVELELLEGAPMVNERDTLSFHLSTVDEIVRAVPLDVNAVVPGTKAFVRLKSATPLFAFAGARFVVRKPGQHGQGTIGGGRVLDPHPTEGKGAFARWQRGVVGLAKPSLEENVSALLEDARNEGLSLAALAARLPPRHAPSAIEAAAAATGIAIQLDGERRFLEAGRVDAVANDILQHLEVFHRDHPLLSGPSPTLFEGQISGARGALALPALERLVRRGDIVRDGAVVRLAKHQPSERTLAAIVASFAAGVLAPPSDEEVRRAVDLSPPAFADALSELKRTNRLALVGGLHFDISALDEVARAVVGFFHTNDALSTGDLKEIAGGVSRKFAIPLLEWLDKEGVTVRQGDVRRKGSRADNARFSPAND